MSTTFLNSCFRLFIRSMLIAVATVMLYACGVTDSPSPQSLSDNTVYTYVTPSRDGTGKQYMGRDLSHVMGHLGAGWLERPEREQEERTDLLIENLPLEENSVVADIGAGTGYFSFPIARRVPRGEVLAVDIQPEMISMLTARAKELGVENVTPVLGTVSDPGLKSGTVDLIFIVDAYHEFSHPLEMGQGMVKALKPGGQLVLIEYRGEDPSVPIKRLHKMTEQQAKREMAALGLRFVRTENFLPQQHFMVFAK